MTAGMAGGQKKFSKGVRRFGIPSIAFIGSLTDGLDWRDFTFFLLIIPLCIGYGENSVLMGWLGSEYLVRAIYALLLSLPFFFFGLRRGLFASVLLIAAFQIHAGSLGNIDFFGDILLEDIIRYFTLGILIAYNIFVSRKS